MPLPLMLVWVLAGVVIGVLSGFMGVGGGIVLTPVLLYLGFKPAVASATSLAFIIPVGWAGIMKSGKDVDVALATVIAVGAVIGTYAIGRPLVEKFNLNPALYKRVFGVVMMLVALDMVSGFSDKLKERSQQMQTTRVTQPQ